MFFHGLFLLMITVKMKRKIILNNCVIQEFIKNIKTGCPYRIFLLQDFLNYSIFCAIKFLIEGAFIFFRSKKLFDQIFRPRTEPPVRLLNSRRIISSLLLVAYLSSHWLYVLINKSSMAIDGFSQSLSIGISSFELLNGIGILRRIFNYTLR